MPVDKLQTMLGQAEAAAVTKAATSSIANEAIPALVAQDKSSANIEKTPPSDEGIDDLLALFDATTVTDGGAVNNSANRQYMTENPTRISTGSAPKTDTAPNPSTSPAVADAQGGTRLKFTETPDRKVLGEAFIRWLKQRIAAHKLRINDSAAAIHLVDGKVFLVSPALFQRFCGEHPELANVKPKEEVESWRWVQKSLEKLKIHHKQPDTDLNIWTCQVKGPRKQGIIKGYLLDASVPPDNPFISLPTVKCAD